ncbi:hypothetical protein HZB07_06260 [Candidatus Saganbacteria bacterium]|nr:hypothetical protein [Candidatus Saganbacteria bacterium]
MNKRKTDRLPREFKQYFWDVDFNKLSLRKHINSILSRLLQFGDMKAVSWIMRHINHLSIKKFIINFGDRQLDRRSNNFWRIYFGLPESKKPVNPLWPY